MITRNYFKVVRVFPDPSDYFYIKTEGYDESTLSYNLQNTTLNLQYSFDKVNWTTLPNVFSEFQVPGDTSVYFRNNSGTFGTGEQNLFYPRTNISIGGDIRTLFDYTDVDSVTTLPTNGFSKVFAMQNDTIIVDISNLSLGGITTIGDNAFNEAFAWTSIQKGLDLSGVTTLGEGALNYMYMSCSSLNEVYAPNVSTWDTNKTINWLEQVPSTGVLYKPANLVIDTDTDSGVPYGWTTQTYPNA
jgi:hypothetical protein